MFREVAVNVEASDAGVTFRFPAALSSLVIVVCNSAGEVIWEFVSDRLKPVPSFTFEPVMFVSLPATPELIKVARAAQAQLDDLQDDGPPDAPRISEVRYGILPPGYRERVPPVELSPGDYRVNVFSDQGQSSRRFHVAAA